MLQRYPSVNKVNTYLRSHPCLALPFPYSASLSPLQAFLEKPSFMNTQIPVLGLGSREPNPRQPWYKSANLCQDQTEEAPPACACWFVCSFKCYLVHALLLLSFLLGLSFTCIHSLSEIKLSLWAAWYWSTFFYPYWSTSMLHTIGHKSSCQLPRGNSWPELIVTRPYYFIHENA